MTSILERPRQGSRPHLALHLQPTACTVWWDRLHWARFDRAGRWRAALADGVTYRRALSGRVLSIKAWRDDTDRFHDVAPAPAELLPALDERIRAWAGAAREAFASQVEEAWHSALDAAASSDGPTRDRDAAAFARVYQGEPIVPPDLAHAVLLQSTVGCAWHRCTFCTLYASAPRFAIHSHDAFARHADAVAAWLGPVLAGRRDVFLGDANALLVSPHLLARHLEALQERLPAQSTPPMALPWRVSAFCDTFSKAPLDLPVLQGLRQLGLHRVYLGLESGASSLLEWLRKPSDVAAAERHVSRLKAAGIAVSVIFMAGVGGRRFADEHLDATSRLIARLALDGRDAVVLSEFFLLPGAPYEDAAARAGVAPLTRAESRAQIRAILTRSGLRARQGGPHVQMYDARQLLY